MFTDETVDSGGTYYYVVTAVGPTGLESNRSAETRPGGLIISTAGIGRTRSGRSALSARRQSPRDRGESSRLGLAAAQPAQELARLRPPLEVSSRRVNFYDLDLRPEPRCSGGRLVQVPGTVRSRHRLQPSLRRRDRHRTRSDEYAVDLPPPDGAARPVLPASTSGRSASGPGRASASTASGRPGGRSTSTSRARRRRRACLLGVSVRVAGPVSFVTYASCDFVRLEEGRLFRRRRIGGVQSSGGLSVKIFNRSWIPAPEEDP